MKKLLSLEDLLNQNYMNTLFYITHMLNGKKTQVLAESLNDNHGVLPCASLYCACKPNKIRHIALITTTTTFGRGKLLLWPLLRLEKNKSETKPNSASLKSLQLGLIG